MRDPVQLLRRQARRRHRARSPRRSRRSRSSCGCRISSRTNTPTSSAARATSRTKRTRCSASAAPRATSIRVFRPCFELECRALKRVRDEMGLTNVQVMVPFVRTLERSASRSSSCWRRTASSAARTACKIIMMCELPSNALLADEFLEYLRRLLDRLERHDAAHARPRSRFGDRREAVRRARRAGEEAAADGDRGLPASRASTSASAARARPIIRTSRAG